MERHITANLAEVKIFPQITFNDHKQEHRESVGDCYNHFFLSFYYVTCTVSTEKVSFSYLVFKNTFCLSFFDSFLMCFYVTKFLAFVLFGSHDTKCSQWYKIILLVLSPIHVYVRNIFMLDTRCLHGRK